MTRGKAWVNGRVRAYGDDSRRRDSRSVEHVSTALLTWLRELFACVHEPLVRARAVRVRFASVRVRFACVRDAFASVPVPFARVRDAFACVRVPFASARVRFASARDAFACVRDAFACVRDTFASVRVPFAGHARGREVPLRLERPVHMASASHEHERPTPSYRGEFSS